LIAFFHPEDAIAVAGGLDLYGFANGDPTNFPDPFGLSSTVVPFSKVTFRRDCMSELLDRITLDPDIAGGRPCIRGMRIRVSDVLDLLAAGASTEDILRDYPYLEAADIQAVLKYAARRLNHPTIAA
jgi:uncharacterized protein (DUF433 family)